jgi:hypothetical protein
MPEPPTSRQGPPFPLRYVLWGTAAGFAMPIGLAGAYCGMTGAAPDRAIAAGATFLCPGMFLGAVGGGIAATVRWVLDGKMIQATPEPTSIRTILLPSGNLLVPVELDDPADGFGLRELSPDHPEYERYLAFAEPGEDPRPRERRGGHV